MHRRIAVMVGIIASISMAGAPHALALNSGGANNIVSVQNATTGASMARAKTSVAHDPGPTVANTNQAYAHATCTDCRTVAVAVQVVLVEGPTTDFRPTNVALALNENCLRCATFAFARQEVLSPGRHIEISEHAESAIKTIQAQISHVASSSETFDVMTTDLDNLTQQLVAVVQGEVQRTGATAAPDDHRQVDQHLA